VFVDADEPIAAQLSICLRLLGKALDEAHNHARLQTEHEVAQSAAEL